MRYVTHKNLLLTLVCGLAFTTAKADILYSHSFDGAFDTALAGLPVDVSPSGETWVGASNTSYMADGSFTGTEAGSIFLPLTGAAALQTNSTYNFSLNMDLVADGSNSGWVSLGFSTFTGTPSGESSMADRDPVKGTGHDWFLIRQNGNARAFGGPDTMDEWLNTGSSGVAFDQVGANTTLRTQLITGDSLSDPATLNMFVGDYQLDLNGSSEGYSRIVSSIDDITYVGFSNPDNLTGSSVFNSFEVTVVPEPATYALLLGGIVLGVAYWRRRKE